jgi:hypothetical protein
MKKIYILLFFFTALLMSKEIYAQLRISGSANLVISSGSSVTVEDIVNDGGTITNSGTLEIQGDLENNNSGLFGTTSSGNVKFNGSSAQEITGNHDVEIYGSVEVDNSSGIALTNTSTGSNLTIHGTLTLTNGTFTLNNFDLTADALTGGSATAYVKTNSTGMLKMSVTSGKASVLYPVGNSAYNPITLTNTGTDDVFGVRVIDNEPAGTSTQHMVDRSWKVTEDVAGESALAVTPQWNGTEELTGFDRTSSQVGLTTDNGATYTWASVGAATGSDPYTREGSGFTSVGTFTVGDYFYGGLNLNLKVFLAGTYNATNHNMDNTLQTNSLIPTTDPYGISKTVTVIPSHAVDWVKIELRDATTNTTVVDNYAAFVDQSGNVIEEDGSALKITGVTKSNYYVAVHHRNHLAVMSSTTVDLSAASPSYDFTNALSKAWNDATITSNAAMKEVETGVWALWAGDANGDGEIQYASGGNSDQVSVLNKVGSSTPGNILTSQYEKEDVNLDGEIQYASGSNSDQVLILNTIGASTPGNIFKAHFPQ